MEFIIQYTHAIRQLTTQETVLILRPTPFLIYRDAPKKGIVELSLTDFKGYGTEEFNRASIILFKGFGGFKILKDKRSTFSKKIYYND